VSAPLVIAALVVLAFIAVGVAISLNKARIESAHGSSEKLRADRNVALEACARAEVERCGGKADVCQSLSDMVFQARESAALRVELLEAGKVSEATSCAIEGGKNGCQTDVQSIETLLFAERAVLPPSVFGVMHEIRNVSVAFESTSRRLAENPAARSNVMELGRLRKQYEQVDDLYGNLLDQVHDLLGVCACAS